MVRRKYELPKGLSDEIRWMKYFSLRSLGVLAIMLGIMVIIGILFKKLLAMLGIVLPFIVVWLFLTFLIVLTTIITIPAEQFWLQGGGECIDQMLVKRLIRKMNRRLYVKGYNQVKYEEEEGKDKECSI